MEGELASPKALEGEHPSLGKLETRFSQFAEIHQRVVDFLLPVNPAIIPQLDPEKVVKGEIPHFLISVLQETLEDYLSLEERINDWEKKVGREEGKNGRTKAEEGVLAELDIDGDSARVERIHGGYAVFLPNKEFASFLGAKVVENGKHLDEERTSDFLNHHLSEAGFLLDSSQLPKGTDLPSGIHIAIVADNLGASKAKAHEEREIIGSYFDKSLAESALTHKLDILSETDLPEDFDRETVRVAGYDLAARIEEGETHFNLATLGMTPEYAQSHPLEAGLLTLTLEKINEKVGQSTPEQRERLAADVRGGSLRFENLVRYLTEEKEITKLIQEAEQRRPKEEDFQGITLKAGKEGRFVYNQATLKPGEEIELDRIKYKVTAIIASGGQGVVYKAEDTSGRQVAIKELIYQAPEALIANSYTACAFIDGLVARQINPDPDIKLLLNDLVGIVGAEQFGNEFRANLERVLEERCRNLKTAKGALIYRKGTLVQFDPTDGSRIVLSEQQKGAIISAVKEAVSQFADSPKTDRYRKQLSEAVGLFTAESEVLYKLSGIAGVAGSLGLVPFFEYNPKQSNWHCLYMIQEYVEGESLPKKLKLDSRQPELFSPERTIDFMAKFLGTLQKIHERGVVHKDIKPENVTVDLAGNPVLLDFGIAKGRFAEQNLAMITGSRRGTTQMGTLGYNSPEHILGKTDNRSDLYSAGMLLYCMLTGDDPRKGEISRLGALNFSGRSEYIKRQLERRDPKGERIFSSDIEAIILRAIEERPDDRFQSAEEMRRALLPLLETVPEDEFLDDLFAKLTELDDPEGKRRVILGRVKGRLNIYLKAMESVVKRDADRISEMFSRLERLRSYTWRTPLMQSWARENLGVPVAETMLNMIDRAYFWHFDFWGKPQVGMIEPSVPVLNRVREVLFDVYGNAEKLVPRLVTMVKYHLEDAGEAIEIYGQCGRTEGVARGGPEIISILTSRYGVFDIWPDRGYVYDQYRDRRIPRSWLDTIEEVIFRRDFGDVKRECRSPKELPPSIQNYFYVIKNTHDAWITSSWLDETFLPRLRRMIDQKLDPKIERVVKKIMTSRTITG